MGRALPVLPLQLDEIDVASPCSMRWADMVGGDKVRFCASCQKNVFNLSGMTRTEAVDLIRATEGRLCVRFFRRADGTVLTEDCPVGVALVLKRAKRATRAAAAVAVGAIAAAVAFFGVAAPSFRKGCTRVIDDLTGRVEERPLMGEMGAMVAVPPADPVPNVAPTEPIGPGVVEVAGGVRPLLPPPPKHAKPAKKKPAPQREIMGDIAMPND